MSLRHMSIVGAAVLGILVRSGLAPGQEYVIEELGVLGPQVSAAPAINNHGQVAFTAADPGGGPYRASLWLPTAAYGMSAGLHDLGTLGGMFSEAYDINDHGQVVGDAELAFAYTHAFRWDSTSQTLVDLHTEPQQANWSYARGINNHGDVVGFGDIDYPDGLHIRAFLWRNNTVTDLGTFGGDDSMAFAINDAGQATGWAETATEPHVFLWLMQPHADPGLNLAVGLNDTHLVPLTASSDSWGPFALNRTAQIVGSAKTAGPGFNLYAFHREAPMAGAAVTQLAPPPSRANAINERGQVVGMAILGETLRAVLWQGGQMIDLSSYLPEGSDWQLVRATDINDRGQIVGYGYNDSPGGGNRVFLMTPQDQDNDGLFDIWETQGGGIDANDDGTIDLDLYALGARPNHKDLFVEVDAMTGLAPVGISPIAAVVNAGLNTNTSLDLVVDAFLNAPLDNPDGQSGIRLRVALDETNLTREAWPNAWSKFNSAKQAHFGTPAQRADANAANILAAKKLAYRYCIFAEQYGGASSSGLAELPGDDFMVTLGHPDWHPTGGTADQQAGTFMHEMGHTLGLHHGGADDLNYKPNYKSVMSYAWQLPNLLDWELDYSTQALPTLQEDQLNEPAGLGAAAGSYTNVQVPFGWVQNPGDTPTVLFASLAGGDAVDWNDDGDTADTAVAMDLNYWGVATGTPSPDEELRGQQDWDGVLFALAGGANYSDGVQAATTLDTEMTASTYLQLTDLLSAAMACATDIDQDRVVGAADLALLLGSWGPCAACPTDLNQDGIVDAADLAILLGSWGPCP